MSGTGLISPASSSHLLRLALVTVTCLMVLGCRTSMPSRVIEPSVVGIITEMESVRGEDDRWVTVNGERLRVLDPGLRSVAGPGLGVDRLLIYLDTEQGPYFIVSVESVPGCYTVRSDAGFLVEDAIIFLWDDLPNLGVRLPTAPEFETSEIEPETNELIPFIELCLNANGIVISDP